MRRPAAPGILLAGVLLAGVLLAGPLGGAARAQGMLHTPAPGSAERGAILDGLRAADGDPARVFVVRAIRVAGNWAWVEADPGAADPRANGGADGDETEGALLRREGGAWNVVDRPCGGVGCDAAAELARIRAAHPRVPIGVVPLPR